ncbi:MAG: hypothetical protein HY275_14190 [Gemmatimonadetes bacterium]|nr:hypothetical protein [Gemmatimonadota bacterium]
MSWALADFGPSSAAAQVVNRYRVHWRPPSTLEVTATVRADDGWLRMSTTRPLDLPAIEKAGWPALVRLGRVRDATGRALAATPSGDSGWQLAPRPDGAVSLHYELDLGAAQAAGWPAPRELAWGDDALQTVVARALFVSGTAPSASRVTVSVPPGWQVVAPWTRAATGAFRVPTTLDLTENLLAFARTAPTRVRAGGLEVAVVAAGHWRPVVADVRALLAPGIARSAAMWARAQGAYLVVLLPTLERGGEAYRASFAMTVDSAPTLATRARWGHTLLHEIGHYWNGSRVAGADYASSQWFQEGFTDYVASLAMLEGGQQDDAGWRDELQRYIARYERLATPLGQPGTRKGPPLYSGGALLALTWDVRIRSVTQGRARLADALHQLWRDTDAGRRPWNWPDLRAALASTAALDFDGDYARYVMGRAPLPIDDVLRHLGLGAERDSTGHVTRVVPLEGVHPAVRLVPPTR